MSGYLPSPHPRVAILSLDVRAFQPSWILTIRCRCGREHAAPMADLARIKLGEREERIIGAVVGRLRCQGCRARPASVVAAWGKDGDQVELIEPPPS